MEEAEEQPKEWVSKVDFDMIKRIDPGASTSFLNGEYMKNVRGKVKTEMQRGVDFAKVKTELGTLESITDPLNH